MVTFGILGPLEAREDGRALALGGRRPATLLALLLLHANRVVSREAIQEALWGDGERDDPARVRVVVTRVRKALGPSVELSPRAGGYVLAVTPGQLDAERFETAVAEGRRRLESGDPAGAARRLQEALALWRGPALSEL